MKLKYYLRGLGLGIIMTTVILVIVLSNKNETLTDEEIIVKAEVLGMVFPEEDIQNNSEDETKPVGEVSQENQPEKEVSQENMPENEVSQESTPENEVSQESTPENEVSQEVTLEVPATVNVTVGGGDGSRQVADKLAALGAVVDAKSYDDYLVNNGYDMRLQTGTFEVPTGATFEDVTKYLLKKN